MILEKIKKEIILIITENYETKKHMIKYKK